jgi:HNH endonuclease
MATLADLPERWRSKIRVDGHGCWLWTATLTGNGYGLTNLDRRCIAAHRAIWQFFNGPIPHGLQMDHLCRVRRCVSPLHVEPVTASENVLRGFAFRFATHRAPNTCARGHVYTAENTYRVHGTGSRECRTCRKAREEQQGQEQPDA